MRWVTGERYDGMYKSGLMHGQGVYLHADGARYQGQFKENLREGYGVFTFTDGSLYEGQWQNDKPQGDGRVIYPGGEIIATTFTDGHQDIGEAIEQRDAMDLGMQVKKAAARGFSPKPPDTEPPSHPFAKPMDALTYERPMDSLTDGAFFPPLPTLQPFPALQQHPASSAGGPALRALPALEHHPPAQRLPMLPAAPVPGAFPALGNGVPPPPPRPPPGSFARPPSYNR